MLFGERLQQSRNNLNLTQQDIADKMHVSRQTISSWERGNSYPDIDSLVSLSDYYHVSLDVLLKEDTGMKEYLEKKQVQKSIIPIVITLLIIDTIFLVLLILQGLSLVQFNSETKWIVEVFGILNAIGLLQLSFFQMKVGNSGKKQTDNFKKTLIFSAVGLVFLLGEVVIFFVTPYGLLGGLTSGLGFGLLVFYILEKLASKFSI